MGRIAGARTRCAVLAAAALVAALLPLTGPSAPAEAAEQPIVDTCEFMIGETVECASKNPEIELYFRNNGRECQWIVNVDWGDGSRIERAVATGVDGEAGVRFASHRYREAGSYAIRAEESPDNVDCGMVPGYYAFHLVAPPGLSSGDASAPSVIQELRPLQERDLDPAEAAATGGVALVLVAILAFPTYLLDITIAQHYDGAMARLAPVRRVLRAVTAPAERAARRFPRWAAFGVGGFGAAIISGFVDPEFGWNPASVRVVITFLVTFAVLSWLGGSLLVSLMRRIAPGSAPDLRFRASSLLILAASVLLSRVTGFEPGITFGLILGVVYGLELARLHQARATLIGAGYSLLVGLIGWLAYSGLTQTSITEVPLVGALLLETMGALAMAGLASLPIALLPVAGLDGQPLWAWRKWGWAVAYAFALAAFFVVLLPLPISWDETSTAFWTWIALYLAYCALAVGGWYYLGRVRRHAQPLPPTERDTDATERTKPSAP